MTNLQNEMFPEEAKIMWEEYCYHNMLCDAVGMMVKYGSGKVIMDIIDMYKSAEAVKNG
jgi:hypothetical protein